MSVIKQHTSSSSSVLGFPERLAAVRAEMARVGVAGYLVPKGDDYMGEYVPASAERLAWLTGFTGSNGMAVILADKALVVTDTRYSIQVKNQTDRKLYATSDRYADGVVKWFEKMRVQGEGIGFDPALHSIAEIKRLRGQFEPMGISLQPVDGNLIDRIWLDRPMPPHSGVEPFLETFAGMSVADKRARVADALQAQGMAAAFLSDPTDLMWLLNVRARDLPYTPVALSRGVIYADGTVEWLIDPLRVPLDIKRNFGNAVMVTPPEVFAETVMRLKAKVGKDKVLVDERTINYAIAQMLEDRNIALKLGASPVIEPRACKTPAEQSSIRDAHRKDAVAIIRFLAWFDSEAPRGQLDEVGIADKLLSLRKLDPAFRGPSFETIAGFGPNGAIVHYKAEQNTARRITGDNLLLLDSGGQYVGGTTDITRTIAVGDATEDMRVHYTTVLKSHIAVARAVFPAGAVGSHIDALARAPLWQRGLDFGHRVGHGVGCYLSVHEPATDLSARGHDPILPGMVVSNEPGYYREGAYGIRLENLVVVVPADVTSPLVEGGGDSTKFYRFDTLSLVPFDPSLTKLSMIDQAEKEWLAAYHARILHEVGPLLPAQDRAWLETVCAYFMV
jgi:Xaa-Pro aminopeptidase